MKRKIGVGLLAVLMAALCFSLVGCTTKESENGEGGGMQQRFTPAEVIPLEMSDVTLTLWAINGLRK